ncbi:MULTISPECIES: hypothetical protein [Methylococcus]|uniref:Minor tail protein n=1 Tax=Methylococcus capsulatus TaxID=414 RepID=A0ABZ2F8Z8_METCP|nr:MULTISPECIES: hypothetical protein [Methylococcus]MDF9393859.1 hypothetical protein [Methylococcus capsulatus]
MAIILAAQNGNASAPATWAGGVVPGPGDVAVANGKSIVIDVDWTLAEVRNDATGGAVQGGRFQLPGNRTLTANIYAGSEFLIEYGCVQYTGVAGETSYIVGDSHGGTGTNIMGITHRVAGDLHIIGDVYGGSGQSSVGLYVYGTGKAWVKRAISGAGFAATGIGAVAITTIAYYEEALSGPAPYYSVGVNTSGGCRMLNVPHRKFEVVLEDGTIEVCRPTALVVPAQANVRSGTVYGDAAYTGSLAVPPPARVSVGVPTDDTVGTGYITAADLASDPTISGIASEVQAINDRIVYNVPSGPVISIPAPSGPTKTVALAYCYDVHGAAVAGVEVVIRMRDAVGSKGAYSAQVMKALSDANGIATLEIPRNPKARFDVRRGAGPWVEFSGVDADSIELPAVIG